MYKCVECGHVFDDEDVKRLREDRGECHGVPAYEEYCVCPACNGDIDEAKICKCCYEYFLNDEMEDDFCMSCIEKKAEDFNFALFAYSEERESVSINGLLAGLFENFEIERILIDYYKEQLRLKKKFGSELICRNHKDIAMECPDVIAYAMRDDNEIGKRWWKG